MTMRRASTARYGALLFAAAIACAAAGCGKSSAPAAPGAATDTASAAPADACEKLKARIARCKANIKRGSFEMKLDEGAMSSPELCQEAEKMVDRIAQMSGCEST